MQTHLVEVKRYCHRLAPEILPLMADIDNIQQYVQLSCPHTEEKEEDAFRRFISHPDFKLSNSLNKAG